MDRNNLFYALAKAAGTFFPMRRQYQQQDQERKLRLDQLTRQNQRQDEEFSFRKSEAALNNQQQERSFWAGQVERAAAPLEDQSQFAKFRANPMLAKENATEYQASPHLPTLPSATAPAPAMGGFAPPTVKTDQVNLLDQAVRRSGPTKLQASEARSQKAAQLRSELALHVQTAMEHNKSDSALHRVIAQEKAKLLNEFSKYADDPRQLEGVIQLFKFYDQLLPNEGGGQPDAQAPSAMPGPAVSPAAPDMQEPPPNDFLQGSRVLGPSPTPDAGSAGMLSMLKPQGQARPLSEAMGMKPALPALPVTGKRAQRDRTLAETADLPAKIADRTKGRENDTIRTTNSSLNADTNAGRLTETQRANRAGEKQATANAKDLAGHRKAVEGLIAASNGIRSGNLDETVSYHALEYGLNIARHNLGVWKSQNSSKADGVPWVDKQAAAGFEHRVQAAEKSLAAEKKKDPPDVDAIRSNLKTLRKLLEDQQDFMGRVRSSESAGTKTPPPFFNGASGSRGGKRNGGMTRQQYIDGALSRGYPRDVVMKKAAQRYGQ